MDDQIQQVQIHPKKYKGYSEEKYNDAMRLINNGICTKQVADTLNINIETLKTWVKQDRPRKKRGGVKYRKFDEEMKAFVLGIIDETCWKTLDELKDLVNLGYPDKPNIGKSIISKFLLEQKITFKLIRTIPVQRNAEEQKQARFDYATELTQVPDNRYLTRYIFIDESGFQPNAICRYGRAKAGTAPNVAQRNRQKLVTLIGAISGQGIVLLETVVPRNSEDNYDSVKFFSFMIRLKAQLTLDMNRNLLEYSDYMIIIDNCSIHMPDSDWWLQCPFPHTFLPKYSPFLNAIEEVFNPLCSFGPNLRV